MQRHEYYNGIVNLDDFWNDFNESDILKLKERKAHYHVKTKKKFQL